MKNLLLLLASSLTLGSFAQTSGGPDAYGYMWYDSNDAMVQRIIGLTLRLLELKLRVLRMIILSLFYPCLNPSIIIGRIILK